MSDDPTVESPRVVALRAFAAYEAKHWREVASLVHPDALDAFRKVHVRMADGWEAIPSAVRRGEGGGSDDLERLFDEHFSSAAVGNPALQLFARVATAEEMRALEPSELLARYLEAQASRAQRDDPAYQPPVTTREVIGEVVERAELVHVVYRVRTEAGRHGRAEEVAVLPVRRAKDGWRIMLNGELTLGGSMRSVDGSLNT